MDDHLKLSEVARELGVSEKTARRYVKAGDLPSVFMGGSYRVSRAGLAAFVEARRVGTEETPTADPKAEAPLDPPSSRGWLLERTAGHAYLAMKEPEARELIGGLSLEEIHEAKEDIDIEKSLIEHEFERELGHPVGARRGLPSALYGELKAAWLSYTPWLQDLDRRRRLLRERRDSADEARLVTI